MFEKFLMIITSFIASPFAAVTTKTPDTTSTTKFQDDPISGSGHPKQLDTTGCCGYSIPRTELIKRSRKSHE